VRAIGQSQREQAAMNRFQSFRENRRMRAVVRATRSAATALFVVALGGCASSPAGDGYNAFLQAIAAQCKPLIIGSDNMGQAIQFNGLGAQPENYNNFLGKTSALYSGGISPDVYRDSLTSFIGTGSYNKASFDCIIAHLPTQPK
jgi:hypothetical protein